MSEGEAANHGALMDDVYRYQRLFYDLTRKYYLLGRDYLIKEMHAAPGQTVLEVACGTGRNLAKVRRTYPKAQVHGFDISEQMLITARAKLGPRVPLEQGDATDFDPQAMFGRADFDHIMLSYCLSMIPDWQASVKEAVRHLAPGGKVHIVDFGDQADLPAWFKRGLRNWLGRFHVSPRDDLESELAHLADDSLSVRFESKFRGYACYAVVTRAA